jgi:hypothetical protein
MAVGGRPEIPGYPRDQMGQILQSPELAGTVGSIAYIGVPEGVGVALYRLGTRDKAKSLIY